MPVDIFSPMLHLRRKIHRKVEFEVFNSIVFYLKKKVFYLRCKILIKQKNCFEFLHLFECIYLKLLETPGLNRNDYVLKSLQKTVICSI